MSVIGQLKLLLLFVPDGKRSIDIRFIPCSNTIAARYTTPDRRFKACTQTPKTLDFAVVNFELHPSSLYPQA